MSNQKQTMYLQALAEIGVVMDRLDAAARHVSVFGGGREDLQIPGFFMRMFHLGRSVSVVSDMATPAVGPGDLFFVTVCPGEISTAIALVGVAKAADAKVLVVTAQPEGRVTKMAVEVLVLPALTMANDQEPAVSLLPMGSVYKGALFALLEVMILKRKAHLNVSSEAMRANHTNFE